MGVGYLKLVCKLFIKHVTHVDVKKLGRFLSKKYTITRTDTALRYCRRNNSDCTIIKVSEMYLPICEHNKGIISN